MDEEYCRIHDLELDNEDGICYCCIADAEYDDYMQGLEEDQWMD